MYISNSWREDPETTNSLKTKLNLSLFVRNGSCCLIQNNILKKQNAMRLKFTHFPVNKNTCTIKRITFKNTNHSSINFQSLLYASIPAESTSYAPTLFHNFEHCLATEFHFNTLLLKTDISVPTCK